VTSGEFHLFFSTKNLKLKKTREIKASQTAIFKIIAMFLNISNGDPAIRESKDRKYLT
jgi:hypothetical protein